jgi:hypothetical protein
MIVHTFAHVFIHTIQHNARITLHSASDENYEDDASDGFLSEGDTKAPSQSYPEKKTTTLDSAAHTDAANQDHLYDHDEVSVCVCELHICFSSSMCLLYIRVHTGVCESY